MTKHVTLGELISELFPSFERQLGDKELPALATQATLADLQAISARRRALPRLDARF